MKGHTTAPPPAVTSGRELTTDLLRLGGASLAVAAFVFLVAVPYPADDAMFLAETQPFGWLLIPAYLSVFLMPVIAYLVLVSSGLRLWRDRVEDRLARQVNAATVLVSLAGFAAYVSPWGVQATRWLLID